MVGNHLKRQAHRLAAVAGELQQLPAQRRQTTGSLPLEKALMHSRSSSVRSMPDSANANANANATALPNNSSSIVSVVGCRNPTPPTKVR